MAESRSFRVLRFNNFQADLHAGELRKNGIRLKVPRQPFEVLSLLLERPGELVTREELRAELWHNDTFVDFDHSLNVAINKLRDLLSDSADEPRYIQTLPRRGYRFLAPVERVQQIGPVPRALPSRSSSRASPWKAVWLSALGLAALVLTVVLAVVLGFDFGGARRKLLGEPRAAKIQSIVVLPLENLSQDLEQEYFADGITDTLITNLAQISALKVISRTSAMRYKGTKKPLSEIARELHVDAVVEGSVMRGGGRVRISAQLIEAPTDRHLWAGSYERDLRDVLSMQEEVTRAIVSEIRVKLTTQEQARLANTRPINPEAYQLYLKGRYYYNKRTGESGRKAHEFFEQAIQKDPNYALAWAGLADTIPGMGWPPEETRRKVQEAYQKALQLDNTLAEVHTVVGRFKMYDEWDWTAAERELRPAIELDPNYAEAHHSYSHYLMALGRVMESQRESQRALELDPLDLGMNAHLAWHYFYARQYDQAITQCRNTLEMDANYLLAHLFLGQAYEQKGRYLEAVAEFEKASTLEGDPEDRRGRSPMLSRAGHAYALAGKKAEALKVIDRLMKASQPRRPLDLAIVYQGLGDKERALASLKEAVDAREPADRLISLGIDPTFDSLRSDSRFQDLLRRIGLSP